MLIVDDEPPARSRLRRMLDEMDGVAVVGEAGSGDRALAQVQDLAPDLVLLDIRMPGMDGLEVAHHLTRLACPPALVFTTAFDQHALQAFETHALDYLLNPIRQERLRATVLRARELRGRLSGTPSGVPGGRHCAPMGPAPT